MDLSGEATVRVAFRSAKRMLVGLPPLEPGDMDWAFRVVFQL